MENYNKLVAEILMSRDKVQDRTGEGTRRVFGRTLTWDLREGFPAVTGKRLAWKAVVGELLWFLSGSTNVEDLRYYTHGSNSTKKTIWDDNYNNQAKDLGYVGGELGPVYGHQWRDFNGVDQLSDLIYNLKNNPYSRRHLVSAWNVGELDKMALPPCHYSFQCFVSKDGYLDLLWNQRSVDVFLGLPFNIASYALLLHILGHLTGLEPRHLTFMGGDVHIYNNHLQQCGEMISRPLKDLPTLYCPKMDTLLEYLTACKPEDFKLIGYDPHPTIKAPMAI
jgi:thymidylate synthase